MEAPDAADLAGETGSRVRRAFTHAALDGRTPEDRLRESRQRGRLTALLLAELPNDTFEIELEMAVSKAFDTIGYTELGEEAAYDSGTDFLSDTWTNLRPTEAKRLTDIINAAKKLAMEAAHEAIVEYVVQAGLDFASEYPDAPRAEPEA